MGFEKTQAFLYGLRHHRATYGIERMRLLVKALGYPDRSFPTIHVAGTNGKGSVCAMLEKIYRTEGYKTGLFTSPHLVYLGERIRINGENISKEKIISYTERVKKIAETYSKPGTDQYPSFFEFINAVAFLYFRDKKIDIGIIETGLGGELDSTNIISPLISVITTIGRDHEEILGHSIREIASAKAGIIKENTPLVLGALPQEAETTICDTAKLKQSQVFKIEEHYGTDIKRYPITNLAGSDQRKNAAIAELTIKALSKLFSVKQASITHALQSVYWPGRWDTRTLPSGQLVILDTTHNEEGINILQENLTRFLAREQKKLVCIFTTLGVNRAEKLLPVVSVFSKKLILVELNQPRATSLAELKAAVPNSFEGEIETAKCNDILDLENSPVFKNPSQAVLIVGSIYLVGEALNSLFTPSYQGVVNIANKHSSRSPRNS